MSDPRTSSGTGRTSQTMTCSVGPLLGSGAARAVLDRLEVEPAQRLDLVPDGVVTVERGKQLPASCDYPEPAPIPVASANPTPRQVVPFRFPPAGHAHPQEL